MNDDTPAEDSRNPELLHAELGRRRFWLWWLVLALLVGAMALMYLAQRLREKETPSKQAVIFIFSAPDPAGMAQGLFSESKSIHFPKLYFSSWN